MKKKRDKPHPMGELIKLRPNKGEIKMQKKMARGTKSTAFSGVRVLKISSGYQLTSRFCSLNKMDYDGEYDSGGCTWRLLYLLKVLLQTGHEN